MTPTEFKAIRKTLKLSQINLADREFVRLSWADHLPPGGQIGRLSLVFKHVPPLAPLLGKSAPEYKPPDQPPDQSPRRRAAGLARQASLNHELPHSRPL